MVYPIFGGAWIKKITIILYTHDLHFSDALTCIKLVLCLQAE